MTANNARLDDVLAWAGLQGECTNAVINIVAAAYNRAHPDSPYLAPPARVPREPDGRVHGVRGTYVLGCRCASCKAANAAYIRDYKARQKVAA